MHDEIQRIIIQIQTFTPNPSILFKLIANQKLDVADPHSIHKFTNKFSPNRQIYIDDIDSIFSYAAIDKAHELTLGRFCNYFLN